MVRYVQSVEFVFSDRISGMGLERRHLTEILEGTDGHLRELAAPSPQLQAVFDSCSNIDLTDLPLERLKSWREEFSRVVLLGMGGSALGAQAVIELGDQQGPEIIVIGDFDGDLLARSLDEKTALLIVSKSGGTIETLSLAVFALDRLSSLLGVTDLSDRVLSISEIGDNPLRRLANKYEVTTLTHDTNLGGRFSVLSLVGMIPAVLAGVDASALRQGARDVVDATLACRDSALCPPMVGAAVTFALVRDRNIRTSVLMPYHPQLRFFGLWYRQLWAESLGKSGAGTTPVHAMGPEDQHSQLQLYLDGPVDKVFTALAFDHSGSGLEIDAATAREIGLDLLADQRTGDVLGAMQRATIETLARRGRPVRTLSLSQLDAAALGALFMHFMLETFFAGALWGVDPFGQPAVEELKSLAKKYLNERG